MSSVDQRLIQSLQNDTVIFMVSSFFFFYGPSEVFYFENPPDSSVFITFSAVTEI